MTTDDMAITGADIRRQLRPPSLVAMPVVVTPSTGPYHKKSNVLQTNNHEVEIHLDIVDATLQVMVWMTTARVAESEDNQ
jgi:hypothetical protein